MYLLFEIFRLWHTGMPLDLCGIQELAALTDLQLLSLAQSRLLTSQIQPLSQLTSLTHLDISRSKVSFGEPNAKGRGGGKGPSSGQGCWPWLESAKQTPSI